MDGSGAQSVQIPLWGTVLSRIDPPPVGWSAGGWARGSGLGTRLAISKEALEVRGFGVRGFGPFRRALEPFGGPRSMPPQETVMWTTLISDLDRWRIPWLPKREWLALSCTLASGAEYTLAIRPADGDFDRLRAALRGAGVRET
jgi:hypothetical protein